MTESANLRRWIGEFARYFGASFVALAADFVVLVTLTEAFGVHYMAAATVSFMAGMAVIYLLSVRWVFKHRSLQDRRRELLIFLAIGVAGLGLNDAVIYGLTEYFASPYALSKVGACAVVFSFNFIARKAALFRGRPEVPHVA